MYLTLIRIIDLPITCTRAVISGHIYCSMYQPNTIIDVNVGAAYYASEVRYNGFEREIGVISYDQCAYTINVLNGCFSLVCRGRQIASLDIPECREFTHNTLVFCISKDNPLRIYVRFGARIVELELVPN